MPINTVIMDGTLERVFEPRTLESGKTVVSGSIAHGDEKKQVIFIAAWSQYAQDQLAAIPAGSHVIINGQLRKSSYKKDNAWVDKHEVIIFQIEALGGGAAAAPEASGDFDAPPFE